MEPDIRPWYHLMYVTDQIKSADQKAYIAIGVACMVIGLTNRGYSHIIGSMLHGRLHGAEIALVVTIMLACLAAFICALVEFYRVVFPKVNNEKYLKNRQKSAIFWNDVAQLTFEDFQTQYMDQDREDDLIVQLYVLSQITQAKFRRIKRLFTFTIILVAFDMILFVMSKLL